MSGEQLERSILERKASDELRAIATAMSLEPVARIKKADLVDQILRAAGVEVDGSAAGNGDGGAHAPAAVSNGASNGHAEVAPVVSAGDTADGGETATAAVAKPRTRARSAKKAETTSPGTDAEAAASEESLSSSPVDDAPEQSGAAEAGEPSETGESGRDAAGASGGDAEASSNGFGSSSRNQGGSDRNQPRQRDRQQSQNNSGSANNNNNPGPGNQQGDAGNRRSRRRRGRDRQGERDPQGSGQADAPYSGELVPVKGLLDLRDEGYGFLRTGGYLPSQKDVYVSVSQARRFGLRRGDAIEGGCRPAGPSEKYPALLRIDTICGMSVEEASRRPRFEDLTPLFPDERLRLEMPDDPTNVTARIVDLISPIGKGQRGMIVSPSKAGKTTVLKQIAHSVEQNNPDVHLMVLLVDERPEEVTDMRRSVRGEVMASTFDRPADEHTALAELCMERAKRLVELGRDVVIILDGITRLARAYNLAQPATGRIMSGGVDSGALYPPKKFFGAARNIEEGGSLTILATALIETGSKMDEVIFEEFKGTGNMELRLDRKLAERRIYPAIDVNASSTRHEELLFDRGQLQQVWKLRRVLNALGAEGNSGAGLELLMDKIKTTRSNDEFLLEIAKAPSPQN